MPLLVQTGTLPTVELGFHLGLLRLDAEGQGDCKDP